MTIAGWTDVRCRRFVWYRLTELNLAIENPEDVHDDLVPLVSACAVTTSAADGSAHIDRRT
ncbi:hypothetical protein [Micromonospora aurantiaca (nom. illeg.)]|uniref:hypothetical protein n=1 Tax=Micromonospora aurantiaca (nom. illeg.) TaxID=47850 RepID=UPI00340C6359